MLCDIFLARSTVYNVSFDMKKRQNLNITTNLLMKTTSQSLFQYFIGTFILLLTTSQLSAQCVIGNNDGGFDPQNNFFWGQSFTAECDGVIEFVEWLTGGPGIQNAGTLEFFEGETVTATPIYTQAYDAMNFTAANQSLRITFDEPVEVIAGQKYTFETRVSTDLLISTANPYSGGMAYEDNVGFSTVDFVFNVSTTALLSVDDTLESTLSIFPNPAVDELNIRLKKVEESILLTTFNILGDVVFKKKFSDTSLLTANLENLPSGVYIASAETATDKATFRFIKQ